MARPKKSAKQKKGVPLKLAFPVMQHIFSHFERAASCSVFCVHCLSKIELYAMILFNNPMKGLWTSNRWLGFFNTELFLGGQSPEGPCRLQLLLDVKVARALKSPHRESNLLWQVISLFFIPFTYIRHKVHHQIIPAYRTLKGPLRLLY